MNDKTITKVGWLASSISASMFVSYIDQIRLNISGRPGSVLVPTIMILSCLVWILYAFLKSKKDWPIIFCNTLGFVLGIITVITALVGS